MTTRRAGLGEVPGGVGADAAGRAGDQRALPGEGACGAGGWSRRLVRETTLPRPLRLPSELRVPSSHAVLVSSNSEGCRHGSLSSSPGSSGSCVILVFVILEMLTLDFVFLMIAVGSVGGLIAGLSACRGWLQIVASPRLSAVLLLFRPPARSCARSNAEAIPRNDATWTPSSACRLRVLDRFADGTGLVKLANGETWTARLHPSYEHEDVPLGTRLAVVAVIEGDRRGRTHRLPTPTAPRPERRSSVTAIFVQLFRDRAGGPHRRDLRDRGARSARSGSSRRRGPESSSASASTTRPCCRD